MENGSQKNNYSSLKAFWEDYATGIRRSNSGIHFLGSQESYDKITEATRKALENAEREPNNAHNHIRFSPKGESQDVKPESFIEEMESRVVEYQSYEHSSLIDDLNKRGVLYSVNRITPSIVSIEWHSLIGRNNPSAPASDE